MQTVNEITKALEAFFHLKLKLDEKNGELRLSLYDGQQEELLQIMSQNHVDFQIGFAAALKTKRRQITERVFQLNNLELTEETFLMCILLIYEKITEKSYSIRWQINKISNPKSITIDYPGFNTTRIEQTLRKIIRKQAIILKKYFVTYRKLSKIKKQPSHSQPLVSPFKLRAENEYDKVLKFCEYLTYEAKVFDSSSNELADFFAGRPINKEIKFHWLINEEAYLARLLKRMELENNAIIFPGKKRGRIPWKIIRLYFTHKGDDLSKNLHKESKIFLPVHLENALNFLT